MNLVMIEYGFTLTELKEMDKKEKHEYYFFIMEQKKKEMEDLDDLKGEGSEEVIRFVDEEEFVSRVN